MAGPSTITLDEDFTPFAWQKEVWSHPALTKVVRVGRRAGKSEMGTRWVCEPVFHGYDGIVGAPTYKMLRNLMKEFFRPYLQPLIDQSLVKIGESPTSMEISFNKAISGGKRAARIVFASAQTPDVLRGLGKYTKRIWFDEFAFAPHQKYLWNDVIGMLLVDRAKDPIQRLVTSTPFGRDFFYELCERGRSEEFKDYAEFHYTSKANPNVTEQSINELVRENKWGQEEILENIYAEFSDLATGVFGDYTKFFMDYPYSRNPEKDVRYLIALDLGQAKDYTVAYVLNTKTKPMRVVWKERLRGKQYNAVGAQLVNLAKHFNSAETIMDYTGVGRGFYDFVRSRTVLTPVTITSGKKVTAEGVNVPKMTLVKNLIWALQQHHIVFSKSDSDLQDEMSTFRAKVKDGKVASYASASNFHDDCVMSAALLVHGVRRRLTTGIDAVAAKPEHAQVIQGAQPGVEMGSLGGAEGEGMLRQLEDHYGTKL